MTLEHLAEGGHAEKARRPDAHPVGPTAAVADQIKAEFPVRPFHRHVGLAGRDFHALDDQLEVVHQAFDVAVDLFLFRQTDPHVAYLDRACGNVRDPLLDDPHALFELFEPHHETVVVIALGAGWHVKVDLIVEQIRLGLAHVVGHPGRAQQRSGDTVRDRVLLGNHANPRHPLNKDAILREELIAVSEDLANAVKSLRDHPGKSFGQILGHPSHPGVAHGQACAGDRRDQVVQGFAGLQHVEADRDGAGFGGRHP